MTIRCDRICLRDGGRDVLRALSLDIPFGGPLTIVGPAGAGKSALFRVLAGQLRPYAGRLHVHGREVALDGGRNSQVALVDCRSTNYPDFSVWDNIAVPLRLARSKLLEEQVITLAHAVGLGDCLSLRPDELSLVGQRRLALARALAARPALLLLDDPLARLPDAEAGHLLEDLPAICRTAWQQGMAVAVATRSSQVALALGGDTAVVAQGRLQQQEARAIDVLLRPVSLNVARVFGDPPINLLRATLVNHVVHIEQGPSLMLMAPLNVEDPALLAGIRPEDFRLQGSVGDLAFPARVERVECSVYGSRIECRSRAGSLTVMAPSLLRPALGESVVLYADPGAVYLFDGAGALVQQIERATERARRVPEVVPVTDDMPDTVEGPTIFALR
ncbi:MAG: ABC transporter ATP-binding protein [Lautropia sp.]|jgi:ABC transporter related|nr:MAG: ABC transporter ATP-binding protein [Lautropia sp.]